MARQAASYNVRMGCCDSRLYGAAIPLGQRSGRGPPGLGPSLDELKADQSRDPGDLYEQSDASSSDGKAAPSPHSGLEHDFDTVREQTATAISEARQVVAKGRCWSDAIEYNTLADVWTLPMRTSSFKRGFRCAKAPQHLEQMTPPLQGDNDV